MVGQGKPGGGAGSLFRPGRMSGTWTEVASTAMCPRCAKEGTSSRLTHYVTADSDLSIFQERCHRCRHVRTHISDSGERALVAARKAHRAGRTLVGGMVLGSLLAVSTMIATASALAAIR